MGKNVTLKQDEKKGISAEEYFVCKEKQLQVVI